MNKNKDNPVVAKADKVIKGRYSRSGKWIKAHKRTVRLTMKGLANMVVMYLYINKDIKEFDIKKKIGIIARTLKDPKFRAYLKEKHGLTNLRGAE